MRYWTVKERNIIIYVSHHQKWRKYLQGGRTDKTSDGETIICPASLCTVCVTVYFFDFADSNLYLVRCIMVSNMQAYSSSDNECCLYLPAFKYPSHSWQLETVIPPHKGHCNCVAVEHDVADARANNPHVISSAYALEEESFGMMSFYELFSRGVKKRG